MEVPSDTQPTEPPLPEDQSADQEQPQSADQEQPQLAVQDQSAGPDQPADQEQPLPADQPVESDRRRFWSGCFGPLFWTVACVLSLLANLILIIVLIALARHVFILEDQIASPLVDGLYSNFVKMDQAHILTSITVSDTIQVVDTIPVVFDLPLKQNTVVKLVEDTRIDNTTVFLNGVGVPTPIILPKGTTLKIALNLTVPVSQTVPVKLNVPVYLTVPVDIPLEQTQLHEPFVGLQGVVEPYHDLLSGLPQSWQELPLCEGVTSKFCEWFFKE